MPSPADTEGHGWRPRARTIAGFVVLFTSIGMFAAGAFWPEADLRAPAYMFLALAAYGLFGISVPDLLRLLGALLGGAGQALSQASHEQESEADDD